MEPIPVDALKPYARRYIWWQTPEEAVRDPHRLMAQVMDIGTFEDARDLIRLVGETRLREVLEQSQAGWLRPCSWSYWHYRLGLAETEQDIPPLPERRIS